MFAHRTAAQLFAKVWKVKNTGSQAWPADTRLVHVGGNFSPAAGQPLSSRSFEAQPGEEVDVTVNCKAPEEPGQCKPPLVPERLNIS